jgi:hypothetical protein
MSSSETFGCTAAPFDTWGGVRTRGLRLKKGPSRRERIDGRWEEGEEAKIEMG